MLPKVVVRKYIQGFTWVKTKCDMATLKVVESDVTLDKNCRKLLKNVIKININ